MIHVESIIHDPWRKNSSKGRKILLNINDFCEEIKSPSNLDRKLQFFFN